MYNYFNPYQLQQPQIQPQQTQQNQNGSFIQVPTEQDAYNWAVAPGNCISFKVQNKPIVIEKSMGFSQLESPKIERYRLIKEEVQEPEGQMEFVVRSELDGMKADILALKADIDALKEKPKSKLTKETKSEETEI